MTPLLWQTMKRNQRTSWWRWESTKASLKLNIHKTKIMASDPITSWEIDGKIVETVTIIFLVPKISADGDCNHKITRHLLLGRKAMPDLESEVAQSYLTLCDPMDCSLPGSTIHGIFQARILEWVAIPFSRRSSQPRDWTQVSHIVGRRFTVWATRDSVLKSKDITLLTQVHIVKAIVFSTGHIQMWELDGKEGCMPSNWCFWTGEDSWESFGLPGDQISQS